MVRKYWLKSSLHPGSPPYTFLKWRSHDSKGKGGDPGCKLDLSQKTILSSYFANPVNLLPLRKHVISAFYEKRLVWPIQFFLKYRHEQPRLGKRIWKGEGEGKGERGKGKGGRGRVRCFVRLGTKPAPVILHGENFLACPFRRKCNIGENVQYFVETLLLMAIFSFLV